MILVLIIVLIALTFGFIFAKLDTMTKRDKILFDEIKSLQEKIEKLETQK